MAISLAGPGGGGVTVGTKWMGPGFAHFGGSNSKALSSGLILILDLPVPILQILISIYLNVLVCRNRLKKKKS